MARAADGWLPGRREMILCIRALIQIRRRCNNRMVSWEDLERLKSVAQIAGKVLASRSNNCRKIWSSIVNEAVDIGDSWPENH